MKPTATKPNTDHHKIDYSIIVPAFNESAEIASTLATLNLALKQTRLAGEIIVVDNDSTDNTAEISRQYGARVVHESVRKIARVRNRGAEAAQGRYLIFVDADTIVEPPVIQRALALLEGGRVAGGGATLEFDRPQRFFARALLRFWLMLSRKARLAAGCFIFCTTKAFKEVGGFDEGVYASEDVRLSFQLRQWACRNSKKLEIIDMPGIRTSSRKNSNHRHLFLTFLIFALFPVAVRFRSLCFFWYGCRH